MAGGEEAPVLQMELPWYQWNQGSDGIYFLTREQVPPKVHRLDLQSLETREILALDIRRVSELAVSPDGQWFYVVSSTRPGLRDIMLVENFR